MTDTKTADMTVYGSTSSYFTGKLEACLRYKEVPYRFESISPYVNKKIYKNIGVFQIPAIELNNGRWLTDTTPILAWAEDAYPTWPLFPADPATRFLSLLIEDFADEWLWRPAMHYRWSYLGDRVNRSNHLAAEIASGPGTSRSQAISSRMLTQRQLGTFVRGDGVDDTSRQHVDDSYIRVLDMLEPILQSRPYLLGERPSLVDIAFMGPMFRHFAQDPTPAHLMAQRAPGVFEWVARTWNARGSRLGDRALLDEVPADWDSLLAESAQTHLEQLDAHAQAYASGQAEHDLEVQGITYRGLPTAPYRVWCLEQLRKRFEELDPSSAGVVRERLETAGAWEPLWRTTCKPSGHDPENTAPFCRGSRMIPEELTVPAAARNRRRSFPKRLFDTRRPKSVS